ncbi:uncharacterized protein LOC117640263 [Thrips palmi]|uniref:Uncharacterized protein LOC117640263 n=1 Tax=Thrips palmi TaxID=161013 RepID=A0A6P8Y7C3_THRPL|nr:uncharacterized protein LOC117640263 [Thrips palmi]
MARLAVVVAFAAAVCLAHVEGQQKKKTDYTAIVKKVQASGAALPGKFASQWTKVLAGQRTRVLALQRSLLKKQSSAQSRTALTNAFSQLNKSLAKVDVQVDKYNKQQGQEAKQLVQQYVSLLQQRAKATGAAATAEGPVQQLRKNKMALLRQWENRVVEVNSKYRAAYRASLGAAAKASASNKTVRQALRAAFTTLLAEAVDDQEENITTLSAKQFPQVEEFALLAGKNLLELLVAAQGSLL